MKSLSAIIRSWYVQRPVRSRKSASLPVSAMNINFRMSSIGNLKAAWVLSTSPALELADLLPWFHLLQPEGQQSTFSGYVPRRCQERLSGSSGLPPMHESLYLPILGQQSLEECCRRQMPGLQPPIYRHMGARRELPPAGDRIPALLAAPPIRLPGRQSLSRAGSDCRSSQPSWRARAGGSSIPNIVLRVTCIDPP